MSILLKLLGFSSSNENYKNQKICISWLSNRAKCEPKKCNLSHKSRFQDYITLKLPRKYKVKIKIKKKSNRSVEKEWMACLNSRRLEIESQLKMKPYPAFWAPDLYESSLIQISKGGAEWSGSRLKRILYISPERDVV